MGAAAPIGVRTPREMTDGMLHLFFASRRGMLRGVRAVIDFVAAASKSSAVP